MKFSDYFGSRRIVEGNDNIIDTGTFQGEASFPIGFTPKKIDNIKIQVLSGLFSYKEVIAIYISIGSGEATIHEYYYSTSYLMNIKIIGDTVVLTPSRTNIDMQLNFRIWEES